MYNPLKIRAKFDFFQYFSWKFIFIKIFRDARAWLEDLPFFYFGKNKCWQQIFNDFQLLVVFVNNFFIFNFLFFNYFFARKHLSTIFPGLLKRYKENNFLEKQYFKKIGFERRKVLIILLIYFLFFSIFRCFCVLDHRARASWYFCLKLHIMWFPRSRNSEKYHTARLFVTPGSDSISYYGVAWCC